MNGQLFGIHTGLNSVQIVSLLIGPALPLIVAFVTSRFGTHPRVKSILLMALSALASFGSEYVSDPAHFNLTAAIETWVLTFMISVASYKGAWKTFDWVKYIQSRVGVKDKQGMHAVKN